MKSGMAKIENKDDNNEQSAVSFALAPGSYVEKGEFLLGNRSIRMSNCSFGGRMKMTVSSGNSSANSSERAVPVQSSSNQEAPADYSAFKVASEKFVKDMKAVLEDIPVREEMDSNHYFTLEKNKQGKDVYVAQKKLPKDEISERFKMPVYSDYVAAPPSSLSSAIVPQPPQSSQQVAAYHSTNQMMSSFSMENRQSNGALRVLMIGNQLSVNDNHKENELSPSNPKSKREAPSIPEQEAPISSLNQAKSAPLSAADRRRLCSDAFDKRQAASNVKKKDSHSVKASEDKASPKEEAVQNPASVKRPLEGRKSFVEECNKSLTPAEGLEKEQQVISKNRLTLGSES